MSGFARAADAIRRPLEFALEHSSELLERVPGLRENLVDALRGMSGLDIPPESKRRFQAAAVSLAGEGWPPEATHPAIRRLRPLLAEDYLERVLSESTERISGVGPKLSAALQRKEISSVEDLLFFLPRSYEDRRSLCRIAELEIGHPACFQGTVIRSGIVPLRGGTRIGLVGEQVDLSYPHDYIGAGTPSLEDLAKGTHPFAETLKAAKRPMIIVGMGALARPDGSAILALCRQMAEDFGMVGEDWNGFNLLHTAAARVAGLEIGFLPGDGGRDLAAILAGAEAGDIDTVFLLGADEVDMSRLGKAFVIYQGHHGDAGAHRADVILPAAAYTEKNGTYLNMEGRVQLGRLAAFPPGDAREDWTILRALSAALGQPLHYDNLGELRQKMVAAHPSLAAVGQIQAAEWGAFGTAGALDDGPLINAVQNFYMTDPISRSSETMAACSEAFVTGKREATGTDG